MGKQEMVNGKIEGVLFIIFPRDYFSRLVVLIQYIQRVISTNWFINNKSLFKSAGRRVTLFIFNPGRVSNNGPVINGGSRVRALAQPIGKN